VTTKLCPKCQTENRTGARFCATCAASLSEPSEDNQAWLAASLAKNIPTTETPPACDAASDEAQTLLKVSVEALDEEKEGTMEQQPPENTEQPPLVLGGRYEIAEQQDQAVTVTDLQPWKRCWSCQTTENEAGELYCINCGAELTGRRYQGQLISGEPSGNALIAQVEAPEALAILPKVQDQISENGHTLTLLSDSKRPAVTTPIDELSALQIGRGLSELLAFLHQQNIVLGAVAPSDLELQPNGSPQLRNATNLKKIEADDTESRKADLQHLASLLEALTEMQRTTKRLDEDQLTTLLEQPGLADVLSQLRTGRVADPEDLYNIFDKMISDRTAPSPLLMQVGAHTHHGMVREANEDSLFFQELRFIQNSELRSWGLYIVADGMGGHDAGEIASGCAIRGAVQHVLNTYFSSAVDADIAYDEAQLVDVVRKAILQANDYVLREAHARNSDMGTTMTMALVVGDRAIIGNVGDSRTYLYRDGVLRRVSKDHSLVMRLVDIGQITENDIYTHPQRNAVLRSLGDRADVEVDVFVEKLQAGDALFLCSDGQWEMTRDPHMAEIIQRHEEPQNAALELIDAANAAGGEDNITAIVVKFSNY
jgi:serine/threonine protein phosphatase PrpC